MTILVVIPARWGSTRLPGKPLAMIAGRSLLSRTIDLARRSTRDLHNIRLVVATDDPRIGAHSDDIGCEVVITSDAITTGSERALAAAELLGEPFDGICNLQGDAPFMPVAAVRGMLEALATAGVECITPLVQLSWEDLDRLREHKRASPYSGTTCLRGQDGRALWFSKAVLPTIRQETVWRTRLDRSPVYRHLGIYGYSPAALNRFVASSPTLAEQLEGLEQLRLIELGIRIETVVIDDVPLTIGGIDTPADIEEAETLIARIGDPYGL